MATNVTEITRSYLGGSPVDSLKAFMTEVAPLMESLQKASGLIQDQATQQAAAIEKGGAAAAGAIRTTAEVEALKQQQQIDIAKEMNLDELVTAFHGKRFEAQVKKDQLSKELEAQAAVAIYDDPLQWIANYFTRPKTLEQYALADQVDKDMSARIVSLQGDVKQKQAIDLAPTGHLITKAADLQAVATEANALQQSYEVRQRAGEAAMRQITTRIGLESNMLDQWQQTLRMMSQERMERSAAERAAAAGRREDAQWAKLEKQEREEQEVYEAVNAKLMQFGKPEMKFSVFKQLDQKSRSALVELASSPLLGDGFGDGYRNINQLNAQGTISRAQPEVFEFVNKIGASTTVQAILTKYMGSDNAKFKSLPLEEQRAIAMDEAGAQWWKEASTKGVLIKNYSPDNPYKIDFSKVTQWPEMQNNLFAKDMIELQKIDQTKRYNERDLILMLDGKVKAARELGKVGDIPRISEQFSEFFKQAMRSQLAYTGAAAMGAQPARQYNLATSNKVVTGMDQFDAFDPVQVQHYAAKQAGALARAKTGFLQAAPATTFPLNLPDATKMLNEQLQKVAKD